MTHSNPLLSIANNDQQTGREESVQVPERGPEFQGHPEGAVRETSQAMTSSLNLAALKPNSDSQFFTNSFGFQFGED